MILNADQLERKARELALTHMVARGSRGAAKRLLADMEQHADRLRGFVRRLRTVESGSLQPAEEWLLDHADFIGEQIILARREFAAGRLRRLPALQDGELRAAALCVDYLRHTDGMFERESFCAYAGAYQEAAVLTVAEVWSLPLMLRIAVVRRLGELMRQVRERREASDLVDRLLAPLAQTRPDAAAVRDALDRAGADMPLSGPTVVHLVARLGERAEHAAEVRDWLVCRLDNGAESLEKLVAYEHGLQASFEVSAGNCIGSLRSLARTDWNDTFERLCRVDMLLREERAGSYAQMDAVSRRVLLSRVETLARRMRVPESLVAGQAVELAARYAEPAQAGAADERAATAADALADGSEAPGGRAERTAVAPPERPSFVAYYLLDPHGMRALWRALKLCAAPKSMPRAAVKRHRTAAYFGALAVFFFAVFGAVVLAASESGGMSLPGWAWAPLLLLLAFPASEWTVQIVHIAICRFCESRPLLRYDFASGIPDDAATIVAVPVIWSRPEQVREMVDRLELHYLANRDPNLHFALLSDYADAGAQHLPDDEALLAAARAGVRALNEAYGGERGPTFHLLQRKRTWNEREQVWMGWERKRGKLVEFADLLRGAGEGGFVHAAGDPDALRGVRYVITLDADTQLPIGTAQRMIGTIHLPYNRPRLNAEGTRVAEGYGVLQPRIGVSHESAMRSRFARLWSGEPGIDPYAFAVSDPYQDGLEQGIFTGKGIFDVDVFRRVLAARIPDNRVLSHDLLEGGFLRSGLLPDIELIDGHPATFGAYQQRLHRWVRGDWQLLGWLRRRSKDRSGQLAAVDLSTLTRWQIVDNLRRSLLTPALFALLCAAMLAPLGPAAALLAVAALTVLLPVVRALLSPIRLVRRPEALGAALAQSAVTLATLPYQTILMLDAIGRTLYRLAVSKRRLLEWVSSAEVERAGRTRLLGLEGGLALSALFAAAAVASGSALQLAAGLALGAAWLLAPLAIRTLDRPARRRAEDVADADKRELRTLAAEIWRFYEDYATEKDNWLPPDNVQFDPPVGIAHRTSPTNIGLLLVCTVTARDFGFIDTPGMIERLERTVGTVERLDKWSGHLYNWYDTETLRPLPPLYISTVDSGNLAGYLIAAKEGVAEWLRRDYAYRSADEDGRPRMRAESDPLRERTAAASASGPSRLRPVTIDAEASAELAEPGTADGGRGRSEWETRGQALVRRLEKLAADIDFRPLYDSSAQLFSLGVHAGTGEREEILYDLLASEARQASFIAIAAGQVPASHWFRLGRAMTKAGGETALVSWSGTMFEYLMPPLIMRTYGGTVWDSTYRGVVRRQAEYARLRGVPMGVSESGYYAFDYNMNYQYQAFGVPGLGFKRGLEQDLVVAPYATLMALPYAPEAALEHLRQMEKLGARGKYGYYEAVDCTAERLPAGRKHMVVRSFMAHHQGMSLLTLGNMLLPCSMVDRFHADKRVQAAELLLQERSPERPALVLHASAAALRMQDPGAQSHAPLREFRTPHTPLPEVCVLSNGVMTSVVNAGGGGLLRCGGIAVTRWREDPVADPWGGMFYIRDAESGAVWSPGYRPAAAEGEEYRAGFALDRARFARRDGAIRTEMDICVSPECNAELRKLAITNEGAAPRVLEVTSFLELALAPPAADDAHPAFSKLFVQTEYDAEREALLARRRPRDPDERPLWAVHALATLGDTLGPAEYETDRARFIGRGRSLARPEALDARLSGTVGAVVDPALAMRRRLTIAPGETAVLVAVTGVADTREEAAGLPARFSAAQQVERTFQLAWTRSRIDLRHQHIRSAEAAQYHQLAGRVLYTPPLPKERAAAMPANALGQSGLWPLGISGDLPIMLLQLGESAHLGLADKLIRGHAYLRSLGIPFDLVIVNESSGGYQQDVRDALRRAVERAAGAADDSRPGRVYPIGADRLSPDERTVLLAAARFVFRPDGRSLRAQLRSSARSRAATPFRAADAAGEPMPPRVRSAAEQEADQPGELLLWNGWGGFSPDGKEYRMRLHEGKPLPAPWSNVLANPGFGSMVTELGTGYTWFRNSREFKLTPWSNDPVLDPAGEACYVRDETTGVYWSPAPAPTHAPGAVHVAHGHGYTRFEREYEGIRQTMSVYVPPGDPVKLVKLRLRNESGRRRELSATYYAEWVLGVRREASAPYIVTEWDEDASALLARNAFQETFREETAFLRLCADGAAGGAGGGPDGGADSGAAGLPRGLSWTADRREFVGRDGTMARPAGMTARGLSGAAGTFADSCGALRIVIALEAGEERTVYVALGCARTAREARELAVKYGDPAVCEDALEEVGRFWGETLGQLQVATPSREMNMLLNGWLLYQALACRMWARTAFYQAGGAFGFRDQLQDSLALLHARPELTREQILLHAGHQYLEGDVQHWWHKETERGIRTRYTDDLLWLPYAVVRYIEHTGDRTVLDELRPFLVSEPLRPEEHERYEATVESDETASIYEHCLRAIDRAFRTGGHGLPLMGIGDWNDGMNSVGDEGRGESVWLGWFLLVVLSGFAELCEARGDADRAEELRARRAELERALNEHAWDGEWYRRAHTDHGDWLGTNRGGECRIDAIAQSWSVISGGAPPERAQRAMQSFDRELVDRERGVAKLLTPAFDRTEPTPGYIQGYPPGIRENGGQYTHGVIWSIVAWAMLERGDKAFELFHLINPAAHTASPAGVRTYMGEPYVMAADVYMSEPYKGRAGWTWYTGASGWMYQAGVEWVLGLRRSGERLYIRPCIPAEWPGFTAEYRFGRSVYAIAVDNTPADGGWHCIVDGEPQTAEEAGDGGPYVTLRDDGRRREVTVKRG